MAKKVCPDCHGHSPRCRTCNPSAAVGDRLTATGRRARNTLTGRSETRTATGVRRTRLGTETVTLTPAQKAKLRAANGTPTKRRKGGNS